MIAPQPIAFDPATATATYGPRRAALNRREAAVFAALLEAGGAHVPSDELRRTVWGEHSEIANLRVTIQNLRRKLEPEPDLPQLILNERGLGYRLNRAAYIA